MTISAQMVKDLREKTGAGMMDCKKALNEVNGDMEAAVDWLRKKGLASAAKKAGRVAAEGKVIALSEGGAGVVLEINIETDFASKNEKFIAFVENVARLILAKRPADVDALGELTYTGASHSVNEELKHLIASIGENMNVRRFTVLEAQGLVASYIHMGGKIGVLVSLASTAPADKLEDLGKKLAMHVAASSPVYLDRAAVPNEALEREKSVLTEQSRASGKPENIIEKMVQGRINKFYGEVCFVEQPYVMDPNISVTQAVQAAAKEVGAPIQVTGYARFALGEGIDKGEKDFAKEVAAQLG